MSQHHCRALHSLFISGLSILYRQIQGLTMELETMALRRAPAPIKPKVNQSFNPGPKAGVSA